METKVIRSESQHQEYLQRMQELIALNPRMSSLEAEQLELLSVIVEAYENQKYPVEIPDPIDAIHFRMQELGWKQTDLIPFIGTRSRVSEILNRKRPLTVGMIRALAVGLGMSADTLVGINESEQLSSQKTQFNWKNFPIKEMVARGWIKKVSSNSNFSTEEVIKQFLSDTGVEFGAAAFRRTISGDALSPVSKYALEAWLARVIQKGREKKSVLGKFDLEAFSPSFLRELAQLSWFDQGPNLAVEFLEKNGIAVVIEPHLKGTLLDGAALKDNDGIPIIGLTLRYDRLDHFWFTLLHEVTHIWKHVTGSETFLDNLETTTEDRREVEANRIAREAFIPRIAWKRSDAYLHPSMDAIDKLSRDLKIHPAIIAGRIRREQENYTLFTPLINESRVRHYFKLHNNEVEA